MTALFPEALGSVPDPQRSGPATDARGRYFFASQNNLIAFLDQGGQLRQIWKYSTGDLIRGVPVVGPDGHIRVHSSDGCLHIVSTEGNRIAVSDKVGEPLGWAAPLVDRNNVTWICGYHGGLYRVEPDGHFTQTPYFRGKQRFDSTGVIHDQVLYVGAENACVYAIPLGETRGRNTWNQLGEQGRTGWYINAALAIGPGPSIIVSSRDDRLYGFDLQGNRIWSLDMEGQMLGSPTVAADGSIYVGLSIAAGRESPRGAMVRVDGVSHRVRWRHETSAPVESTPVLGAGEMVYFGDNAGVLHALDGEGRSVWSEKVVAAIRSRGTMIGTDRVVFGMENGQFVVVRG